MEAVLAPPVRSVDAVRTEGSPDQSGLAVQRRSVPRGGGYEAQARALVPPPTPGGHGLGGGAGQEPPAPYGTSEVSDPAPPGPEAGTTDAAPGDDPAQGAADEAPKPARVVITPTADKASGSGAKERTTAGVGESFRLVASMPDSADESPLLKASWKASKGKGKPVEEAPHAYDWTAPDTADSATVTCTAGGLSASTTFSVVIPTGMKVEKVGDVAFEKDDILGAGMNLKLIPEHADANFSALEWMETQGEIKSSGSMASPNTPSITHNDTWTPLNAISDVAKFSGDYATEGSAEYVIAQNYRAGASGKGKKFADITQTFSVAADGLTATVKKGGATATRKKKDPKAAPQTP
jgi:hypothetical protein